MLKDDKKFIQAHKIDVKECFSEYRFWVYFFMIEDCDLLDKFELAISKGKDGLINWAFWIIGITSEGIREGMGDYRRAVRKVGVLFHDAQSILPKWNEDITRELLGRAKAVRDYRLSDLVQMRSILNKKRDEDKTEDEKTKERHHENIVGDWNWIIAEMESYLTRFFKRSQTQKIAEMCDSCESMSCNEDESSSYCDICDCVHIDV